MPYEAKTDWKYDDLVTEKDMNRIEQGLKDAHVPAYQPLTLNPGLQVVEVENDTPFRMGEVKGRTLMNLPGREGNFDYRTSPLFTFFGTGEIIPASTPVGTKVQKIVCNRAADSPGHFGARYELNIDRSKHYVAVAYLENISCDEPVYFSFAEWKSTGYYTIRKSGNVKKGEGMRYRYIDISPDRLETQEKLVFYFRGEGTAGAEFRIGAFGLYEISQSEYEAIGKMKFAQVAERYPYVDSMTNVKNPYAIVTGGNLLPSFYHMGAVNGAVVDIQSAYEIDLMTNNTLQFVGMGNMEAKHKSYRIDFDPMGTDVKCYFNEQAAIDTTPIRQHEIGSSGATITIGDDAKYIGVYFGNKSAAGSFKVRRPMLVPGSEPKPFTLQQRSMLAFEAELAAHPVNGSNPDTLFMGDDGLPYVLEPWKKVTLDGSFPWNFIDPKTGFKRVAFKMVGLFSEAVPGSGHVTKYDGKYLSTGATGDAPDVQAVSGDGYFYISISNTDSGWGQDYNPTQDEIKAYFLGWKMYDATGADYNDPTGGMAKWWQKSDGKGGRVSGTQVSTVPTTLVTDTDWHPYRLQYLKAKPTVEPVRNYEMGATLSAGSNMVEVGSGIVIREKANPVVNYINAINAAGGRLKYRTTRLLAIYRNQARDFGWTFKDNIWNGEPYQYAEHPIPALANAVYHVTYTMLDPTLAAPFNCTVSANLRGTVSDLVRTFRSLESGISMTADDVGAATKAEFDDLKNNAVVKNGDSVIAGMLSMSKNDGPHLQLKGTTSSFGEWYVGNERKGYFGVGDASNPDRVSVVSEKGSLNLYGAQGVNINGIAAYRQAVYLGEGTDLNAVTGEGLYYCPANVTVQTMKNVPLADAFALQVFRHAGVTQVFYNYRSNPGDGNLAAQYKRSYYNNHWTPWYKVADSRDIDDLKQSVVDGKGKVAGAINDMGGGPVSANNTFDELAAAIRANQGASGDTRVTQEFIAHIGQDGLDGKISGRFWFNKDGNAVGLTWDSSDSYKTYNVKLLEVTVAGTIVSAKTLESNLYSKRSFNNGFGIVTPYEVAYLCKPDQYGDSRLRIRNHAGTILVDSQINDNDINKYHRMIDITNINGQYRFTSLVEYGSGMYKLGIVDQNTNVLFECSGIGGYNSFKTGGNGRFLDRRTAVAFVGGTLIVRWDGSAFVEAFGGWITDSTHQNILSAYAYRD
ncbi:hypothetical protein HFN20_23040 [Paenibacillus dendritiformis]|uniref:pyocin knob domain-containing protein n=1 Tax=Paenibacillus dendritiformis TaxID=130049 RepID=UPI00143CFDD2|nr:pyocin knob domain-containing protein [Paenibacillus dendritiformis]NKI24051.1 hypothetical protein [Paenibacillus dendritiformis]NRG00394.1 hypothetical protein [Paenibacillus dendritiformis]